MDYLEIKNFSVKFGDETILDNVNITLPLEGITVLIGRSGSGKTTLLRAVNRLNESHEGHSASGEILLHRGCESVSIYDIDEEKTHELRRRVGMVFQTPNPLPVSIRKNIELPVQLVLKSIREESREKTERVLRQVGLWEETKDKLGKSAMKLSGGQQQRLCFARALALEPELLLLDEPTASLDKKASEVIEKLIKELSTLYPVIMVSHSLGQAVRLGDRFVAVDGGHVSRVLEKSSLPAGAEEAELEKLL